MKHHIKILKNFEKYVKQYNMNDEAIRRKYYHSIRVMNFALSIGKSLKIPRKQLKITAVSGLLHDYARFEQWKRFHTYSDVKSIDHGDLAVELLFENREIERFYKKKENYEKIYYAIKYHNKYEISEDVGKENLELCNIIREADKLDIFDILANNDNCFQSCNEEITKEIEEDFFYCKMINYKDIKNANDDIVLKLAMFFDIKYNYSIDYIVKTNMLQRIFNKIQDKERFRKYFEFIEEYIQKRYSI